MKKIFRYKKIVCCRSVLGYESCVLVGHGLGGLVAWTTAML